MTAMPYLAIETNVTLTPEVESTLLAAASTLVASQLSKPESYVMVSITPKRLRFAGSDQPAAFVSLQSIGLPRTLGTLAAALNALVAERCGIPADRVFIVFSDVPASRWAHEGELFG